MPFSPADWTEPALRLGVATLVGALIGLDRELMGKPLGFRTLSVVAVASCALVVAADHHEDGAQAQAETVSRAIQGLMAGVGFLGGGVILRQRPGHVSGLTTAALVWLTAALGVACGLAAWPVVVLSCAFVLLALLLGAPLDAALKRRRRARRAHRETHAPP
jgi:putative Mg2+ transporter-C (MgtC) family protein